MLWVANNNLRQYHHVAVTVENKMDLHIWKVFLQCPDVFVRPFFDMVPREADQIDMYSDASMSLNHGGFEAYCNNEWTCGAWDKEFLIKEKPSIEYLELYVLTVGVLNWIKKFKNHSIYLFCNNQSVQAMVNTTSSKCKNCMRLLRLIVLEGLIHNVNIKVKFVATNDNGKADALSRGQFPRFWKLGLLMNEKPKEIPKEIWPVNKIWLSKN